MKQRGWVRTAAMHYSVDLTPLGQTVDGKLRVKINDDLLFRCEMEQLEACRHNGLAMALDQ